MQPDPARAALLGEQGFRRALSRSLERRLPASDVEDLVQETLLDALAAAEAPSDGVELRRWVYGILRHKVANHYRRRGREVHLDAEPDAARAGDAPSSARELLRWAERELPAGDDPVRTLDWMLEESDGEKLEDIARAERVPAPRVRQRIARLRRHFRARWAAELAAVVSAIVVAIVVAFVVRRHWQAPDPEAQLSPEPSSHPPQRAQELRRAALEECTRREFVPCLRALDDAKQLDPAGDAAPPIQAARQAAGGALTPAPTTNSVAPAPTASAFPKPVPSVPAPRATATPPSPSSVPLVPAPRATATPSTSMPSSSSVPSSAPRPSVPRHGKGYSSL